MTRSLQDILTSWALPHGKFEALFVCVLSNYHVSERRVNWLKIIVKAVTMRQLETQITLQG